MRTEREILRKGVNESAVALATKNPSPIPIKAARPSFTVEACQSATTQQHREGGNGEGMAGQMKREVDTIFMLNPQAIKTKHISI